MPQSGSTVTMNWRGTRTIGRLEVFVAVVFMFTLLTRIRRARLLNVGLLNFIDRLAGTHKGRAQGSARPSRTLGTALALQQNRYSVVVLSASTVSRNRMARRAA